MIHPEAVKTFFLHDDPDVREQAVTHFSDAWSQDPSLLALVLDACDQYGISELSRCLYSALNFVVDRPSLARLLRYLELEEQLSVGERLNSLILGASREILKEHLAAIEANPRIEPVTLRRVRRRVEYLDWSGDQLWAELQTFADRSDKDESGEIDFEYAEDLIEALSHHNMPDVETLCRLIRKPEKENGWLDLFLIDLAGDRRLKEAVTPLVERLHEDADFVLENCSGALAKIGDSEAVRLIRRAFAEAPFHFKLFGSNVLGAIRDPEAETAILELLNTEEDHSIRVWLCSALCDQLSERCLEVVGREIASGDPLARRELSGMILSVATILGQELPAEAAEWREVRDRQRESLARYESEESDWDDSFAPDPGIDPSRFLLGAGSDSLPRLEVTAPIRNTGQRVGRNDPCPCGSGKKYKKCCGKA